MKKFCNKITKQQWRVTVPNIHQTIFRKSPAPGDDADFKAARSSGSYDLEEAQKEYDRSRSLPISVYVDSDNDSSDCEEHYQDAQSGKVSCGNLDEEELYADVVPQTDQRLSQLEQYEYDVPKISFSFFGKKKRDDAVLAEAEGKGVMLKSEVKIVLSTPPPLDEIGSTDFTIASESVEILPIVGVIRCGSDPSLTIRDHKSDDDDDDDSFYKTPRKLTPRCRLSQSLHDFNSDFEGSPSNHTSIEHISCSQVIVTHDETITSPPPLQPSESLDYCTTRTKLPLVIRRPTFLRKAKWNNFRAKINNMMHEQAAQQRVGAFDNKEKIVINFEEVYQSSKAKCKNALKSTTKLFRNKNDLGEGDSSSQIVKNDAFFAKVPLTPKDIEYKFDFQDDKLNSSFTSVRTDLEEEKRELDFSTIKSAFRRIKPVVEGQNGFEDLRRYVKQGGDFCKELAAILQERAETESQYAKSLSKLSVKLSRACREGVGGLNEAWKAVAVELEARAEVHRIMGQALLDETAKPLRTLTENQHRTRKQCETAVEKAAKSLADWRATEAKSKKQSHACARDNEKLQDAAILDTNKSGKLTLSRSTSLIQLAHMHNKNSSDKENAKLEGKKRKAEDAVKKADIEYYTLCVRAERARLEWESSVMRGVNSFQALEEERLRNLKLVLGAYLQHENDQGPKLIEATERLTTPVKQAEAAKDLSTFINLRHSSQQISEQLLPDFYCEHITLAMNRERRKQALVKLMHLIRQDIERERKSKNGLANLSKAIKQTPNFGAEDSQQNVSEKLYHMKSMLTYLEGARYKIHNALAELDNKPKSGHPLAPHITITRDKSGLQQSILKVPQWLRDEWSETQKSPISEKSMKSNKSDNSDPHNNDIADDWTNRGAADGNSNQPDSDFDEFSSQCSSAENMGGNEEIPVKPIAHCKAIYAYTPNLTDELALQPGDLLSVYRQQDDGWWLGECRGNVGIFPATYVEIVSN